MVTKLVSNPKLDSVIDTLQGQITIKHGAIALIDSTVDTVTLYNLYQPKPYLISFKTNSGVKYTLAPSKFASVGKQTVNTDCAKIKMFETHRISKDLTNGSFLISSALLSVPAIRKADIKTIHKICMSAAILEKPPDRFV